jgi:hypothetical protein
MQRRTLLSALVGFALASPMQAGDGAIEINAASAAGQFPIVISQPGSYRLTSNLDGGGVSQPLIQVFAASVTLDLNGFTLSGGLRGVMSFSNDVTVRNGTVRGMSELGIWLMGSAGHVEAVRLIGNRFGIEIGGDGGLVLDSIVVGSGGFGIRLHSGTILRCVVASGGDNGFDVIRFTTPTVLNLSESAAFANSRPVGALDASLRNNLFVGNSAGVQVYSGQLGATGLAGNVFSGNGGGAAWSPGGLSTAPNLCSGAPC